MTALFRTHGLDICPQGRHLDSLYAFDGTILVGRASPWIAGQPDGDWYARRTGKRAVRVATRHEALAHIVRGCPDCSCEPGFCRTGGLHCQEAECKYCLVGCPEKTCEEKP